MTVGPSQQIRTLLAAVLRDAATGDSPAFPAADCAERLGLDGVTVCLLAADGGTELLWYDKGDKHGPALADLQYTLGEGPTPDAVGSGRAVLEGDLTQLPALQWPGFRSAALDAGILAAFAFPLRIGAIHLGAVTGYRALPGPLSEQQMSDALAVAEALTLLLAARARHGPLNAPAETSGLHRAEVHQATGMLSVHLRIPLEQALLRLRAHAYSHDRPILDVAHDIITNRLRLDADTPHPPPG
ncbi:GAF and ANTAR domain-containing protein [Streptomyces sp. H27-D2]|uniref:GAF and ANTAR domain-containing protein n=1 Tax=Streptomyces sp. H27-D2 TaxID=3046304 RepID=UPI002DC02BCE|nr:GAF and ANTAR domain-containing protein [Streptomyces sp. H27-D2]MEC4018561.1 GAF and ANTAR domain-containing protein [Streptomyces sp. H27-D2]